jgi:hypothetical protein
MPIKAGALKKLAKDVELPTAETPSKNDQMRTLRDRLTDALQDKGHLDKPTKERPWVEGGIEDVYDNTVVFYRQYNDLKAASYTDIDGKIALTKPIAVERRTIYVQKRK